MTSINTNTNTNEKESYNLFTLEEYKKYFHTQHIKRNITAVQLHHTWSPAYRHFNGHNHYKLWKGMRDYHVLARKFQATAAHVYLYPDGILATGRNLRLSPAGIYGKNRGAICIEIVGCFDAGYDSINAEQETALLGLVDFLTTAKELPKDERGIVYHAWYNRTNGKFSGKHRQHNTKEFKTCPGNNFYGGNSVESFRKNFLAKLKNNG